MTNLIVLFQARLVKVAFLAPVKNALEITSALRLLVSLEMLFQVAARGEAFGAVITLEWLFARMNPLVTYQI